MPNQLIKRSNSIETIKISNLRKKSSQSNLSTHSSIRSNMSGGGVSSSSHSSNNSSNNSSYSNLSNHFHSYNYPPRRSSKHQMNVHIRKQSQANIFDPFSSNVSSSWFSPEFNL